MSRTHALPTNALDLYDDVVAPAAASEPTKVSSLTGDVREDEEGEDREDANSFAFRIEEM